MKKRRIQLIIDILMTLSLPLLMAYSLIGENFHEIMGTAMGCLFITHNILNRQWHATIFRGKYNTRRTIFLVTDLLLIIDILLLMSSGIILSTFVFSFVDVEKLYGTARLVHLCASYWGFLLMSFHVGLHIPLFVMLNGEKRRRNIFLIVVAVLICGFGIYSFIANNFFDYLFLRTHFAFLDFEKPRVLFFAEYISIMFLFASVGTLSVRLATCHQTNALS